MTLQRKLEWLLIAVTAGLLISLKYLHYGVTQYKLFLLILLGWSLIMIIVLRSLHKKKTNAVDEIEP